MKPQIYSSAVTRKKKLTSDILELQLAKPTEFHYLAGQFVQWRVPDKASIILRSFSLSSTPEDKTIEFCVEILNQGKASSLAQQLQLNDILQFQGPHGKCVHTEKNTPFYCVATGTGIAPILSIIRDDLEYKKTDREVRLLWGVRSQEDIFWLKRLERLKQCYDNFSYQITLSQPKSTGGWAGLHGYVTNHVLHHLTDHEFFLCGNASMVKDVRQLLMENGVKAGRIHFEIFSRGQ